LLQQWKAIRATYYHFCFQKGLETKNQSHQVPLKTLDTNAQVSSLAGNILWGKDMCKPYIWTLLDSPIGF
jgi:hypothetical protein